MTGRAWMLAPLLVLGCTTPASVGSNAPFYRGQAVRPAADVAGCIATAWGKTPNFHTRVETAGDRTDVILAGSSVLGIDMVANVFADGRVEMHKRSTVWGSFDDKRREEVRSCL